MFLWTASTRTRVRASSRRAVAAARARAFVKTHQTVPVECVYFTLCTFYLDLSQFLEKLKLSIKFTMKDLK